MILGNNISKLTVNRKRVKPVPMMQMLQTLKKDFNANKAYLNQVNPTNKYHAFRKARAFECVQILEVLKSGKSKKETFTEIRQILADAKVTDFADFFRLLYEEVDI